MWKKPVCSDMRNRNKYCEQMNHIMHAQVRNKNDHKKKLNKIFGNASNVEEITKLADLKTFKLLTLSINELIFGK
jgi:hypothetical protein